MPKSPAIPADRVTILFLVMLVAAAGNTAMQSALPAIASKLDIADVWVLTAPKWARLADKRGRKALMTVGVIGFAASMGLCGLVLWLGLEGFIAPAATFIIFAIFRSLYGGFGSAAPPAVQAYIAARTEREERAKALSLLASSFGLGTVIGPALAHFLIFEPFGLAGPLVVFASFGVLVLIGLKLRLPNDTPRFAARGIVTSYPSAASVNQPEVEEGIEEDNALPREEVRLRWRDERFASWLVAGLIGLTALRWGEAEDLFNSPIPAFALLTVAALPVPFLIAAAICPRKQSRPPDR